MTTQPTSYAHSGSFGPALFLVPILGLVAATAISVAYAFICVYSPIAGYISILFVGGFGFALGFAISRLGHMGKCRNTGFLQLCGFTTGVIALYVSWVVFIFALYNQSADEGQGIDLIALFMNPEVVWNIIRLLNETGWYSIKSWTPTGVVLWIFWGIEAVVVVGMATLMSTSSVDDQMFCETCNKWCDDSHTDRFLIPEDGEVLTHVQSHPVNTLSTLDRAAGSVYPRINMRLFSCQSCSNTGGFALDLATIELDKDGKTEVKTEEFLGIQAVSSSDLVKLKALAERPEVMPEEELAAADEGTPEPV